MTDPDWSPDAQPHSGTWRQFFTCTREEFLDEFVHPDDRPAVGEARQKRALQVRAEYLTEMRKKAGLTQAGVAEAMDVSQQRVSAIEPAGITYRVDRSHRTLITRDVLRRARHLYLTDGGYALVPPRPRRSRSWWSRPVHADGCSMVARMPRYGPAPPGIRSTARMRATGQNGSSRHVLALLDSS